jgi:regulator of protease activity HflC (stomatin/prohibitin superfamily)
VTGAEKPEEEHRGEACFSHRRLVPASFWFWRVIQPDEAGVRTTIGKWPTILAPGIHLVWPIVGLVRVCKTSEQVSDIRSQSLTTSDGQCFAVGISIAHSIINAQKAMLDQVAAQTILRSYFDSL